MYTRNNNKEIDKIPINVGLSLGILSQDKVYNLMENPETVNIKKQTLLNYIKQITRMNYENDVDINKMLDNLKVKKGHKVFILTDQKINIKIKKYNITIWNISDEFIKVKKDENILYINGFSKCIYNHVLQNPFFDPSEIVDNIVKDVKYKKILEKIK